MSAAVSHQPGAEERASAALGNARVEHAAAHDRLAAAELGLLTVEAQIDATTTATPTEVLERLFAGKQVAQKRVEHAKDDLRRTGIAVDRWTVALAEAPQLERDLVVQVEVKKIVALEAKAKAVREALDAIQGEQVAAFQVIARHQPRWERVTFMDQAPLNVYEGLRSVLERHAGAVAPDYSWNGLPFMTQMARLHRVQDAHVMARNEAEGDRTPYASEDDFDHDARLRLRHSLDCLGSGVAHAACLVENVPLATLYALAGARLDQPGRHPSGLAVAMAPGDLSGETLGRILVAVAETGPAFRQACARKAFDVVAVRRSQGEWVAEPTPPEAA